MEGGIPYAPKEAESISADEQGEEGVRDDLIAIAVVYRGTELGGFKVVEA